MAHHNALPKRNSAIPDGKSGLIRFYSNNTTIGVECTGHDDPNTRRRQSWKCDLLPYQPAAADNSIRDSQPLCSIPVLHLEVRNTVQAECRRWSWIDRRLIVVLDG